ncbi:MAG: sarcosine oxidase subunit gamma family protein [Burkholderiaceae bacterium]|jgi:sarcosine oxidase subunit gamma|nr:MAG: sarcosine oxidase subunit gamma family protein [Burkholderiaceae bacterium]
MSEFAIFDAHPTAAFRAESPLSICRITVATQPAAQGAGVVLRECAFLGHLILRGNAADEAFRAGVEVALGVPLPLKVGPVSRDDVRGVSVQWMSPDEWLVVVPQGEDHATEQRLRQALTGHYAVMQVSGAQTMLELSGPNALDVLKKSAGYDFHPRNFPVGKGISTTLAKSTAVVRRVGEAQWELIIRRSFADYLYRWLLDASEEYGVFVAR